MTFLKDLNEFIKKNNLYALREVALFMVITLVIHYSFRYWANTLEFQPIRETIFSIRNWLSHVIYYQSKFLVINVLRIDVTVDDAAQIMYFPNNGFVGVNTSCSGFKQLLQFIILFLVYPGPWKHKLWFIPLGILAVYITNLFRIFGLSIVVNIDPTKFDVFHDYVVRPLFYVVIFALWVWWVEKFYTKRFKPQKEEEPENENPTSG